VSVRFDGGLIGGLILIGGRGGWLIGWRRWVIVILILININIQRASGRAQPSWRCSEQLLQAMHAPAGEAVAAAAAGGGGMGGG
jgi:hypothetical protein